MDDLELLKHALQSLETGIAVADFDDWTILFENAKFFQWFDPEGDVDAPLGQRLNDLDAERARDRLDTDRPFKFETEVKAGPRTINLEAELRAHEVGGRRIVLVECRNISKQKEAEYMLDSYSRMAEKNARELEREKERVEKLLLNIMPKSVYEEMKDFGTTTPQRYDSASVLMLDFVGFTDMAISRDPSALIGELNDIFSSFDRIVELFNCERIKTIGDAYVAVCGIPEASADHAVNLAKVALRMRRYLERRNASHPTKWKCRIGLASGPVIGSMVGVQKYVYDIFGPAPNLASRLEELCDPMQILINEDARMLIRDKFSVGEREVIDVKGFGEQTLYSLDFEVGMKG